MKEALGGLGMIKWKWIGVEKRVYLIGLEWDGKESGLDWNGVEMRVGSGMKDGLD
jgi:hypothetical protein